MSHRVVNHVPSGEVQQHCAMTGVGLLCYEVWRVSHDLRNIVAQAHLCGLLVRFTFRLLSFYTGRITKKERKLCYLCRKERFHRNRIHILKVRTNLYTNGKLAMVVYNLTKVV